MFSGYYADVITFIVKHDKKEEEKDKGIIFASMYAWCNLKYIIKSLDISNLNIVDFKDFG